MISSTANRQVKNVIALRKRSRARKDAGLFVVEGPRMCTEIPPDRIDSLYVSESFAKRAESQDLIKAGRTELVSDEVFGAMSDTKNPQGILALVRQEGYTFDDLFPNDDHTALILVLEHVQDPGNLGTMIRSAEGAGASGILMDEGTADIYSPKVIRSTMGSVFRVPFLRSEDLAGDVEMLSSRGVRLFAADLTGEEDYDKAGYTEGTAFIIGNEAAGLSPEMISLCDERITIPMLGEVESLNAAAAASILLFEAARQRRAGMDTIL